MKKMPDLNLYLCGNDSSSYAQKIRELINEHQLQNRVKLTGEISEGVKNWMYNNCDPYDYVRVYKRN